MSTPEYKRKVYKERKKCGDESNKKHYCDSCRKQQSQIQKTLNPKYKELRRIRRKNIKQEVAKKYGDKCYCCGESNMDMLTLDHINQNGAQHRRDDPSVAGLWRWALLNEFPNTLRLACYNCNVAAYRNNGVCPHHND